MFNWMRSRRTRSDATIPGRYEALAVQQFRAPVRRTRVGSWWDARSAVRHGVRLGDYLLARYRGYFRKAPQNPHPLPWLITLAGPDIVVESNPHANDHPLRRVLDEPAGVEGETSDPLALQVRWLRAVREGEAQATLRDLSVQEDEVAQLNARLQVIREHLVERERAIEGPIQAGIEPGEPDNLRVTGRPRTWGGWYLLGLDLVTLLVLGCEAYQFALPYWDRTGVDGSNLAVEWGHNPLGVLTGAGFALAATGSLFVLWQWLLRTARTVLHATLSRVQLAMQVGVGMAVLAMISAAAVGIGELRHASSDASSGMFAALIGGNSGATTGAWVFVLLTILVPLAVAYLQETMEPLRAARAQAAQAQRDWDAAEDARRAVRVRHEELIALAQRREKELEQHRTEVRRTITGLNERAQSAERGVRELVEAERRYAMAFASGLVAALEQDRFYFLAAARKRGLEALLAAGEPEPARKETATDVSHPSTRTGERGNGHDTQAGSLSELRPPTVYS